VCHLSLLLAGSNTATTHYPYSQQKVKLLYETIRIWRKGGL